jgi:hypothetical protein
MNLLPADAKKLVPGRAQEIVRGVQRMLADMGSPSLTEVALSNGRRADVLALSSRGEFALVEVKSCLQDFTSDRKWPDYAPYCDAFYFAVDCDFPRERLPETAGLIVADGFGGAILREAATQMLAPARRKAMTLGFARLAAARLLRADDGAVELAAPAIDAG